MFTGNGTELFQYTPVPFMRPGQHTGLDKQQWLLGSTCPSTSEQVGWRGYTETRLSHKVGHFLNARNEDAG